MLQTIQKHIALYPAFCCLLFAHHQHPPTMDLDIGSTGTPNQHYNCICSSYNFGQPHLVSSVTWYRHLQEASVDKQQHMQDAKFISIASSSNCRARGTASHRHNNVLPMQKRACEPSETQVSASPDKQGWQGEPQVCFHISVVAYDFLTCL